MKFNRINSLTLSICGHIITVLLLYYGVPVNTLPASQEPPITVDMVNISDLTNIIAKHKAKKKTDVDKKEEKKSSKEIKAAEETKPEPVPEAKPVESKPVTPEVKPQVESEAVPIPAPEKPKEEKPQKEPQKPDVKNTKSESSKKPIKKPVKKKIDPFADASFLKTLEEVTKKSEQQNKEEKELKDVLEGLETDSTMGYNDELPMSISEVDALKAQFFKNWDLAGFHERMKVTVRITYDGEANVVTVTSIPERGQPPQYAAFVASAERAARKSSPLHLSAERLSKGVGTLDFVFDNSEVLQSKFR